MVELALAKDPEERFQSCQALLRAFGEACQEAEQGKEALDRGPVISELGEPQVTESERRQGEASGIAPLLEVWEGFSKELKTTSLLALVALVLGLGWLMFGSSEEDKDGNNPVDVARAWVKAHDRRDLSGMMRYYAEQVQVYGRSKTWDQRRGQLERFFRRYNQYGHESFESPRVRYNDSGSQALVEYSTYWLWQGEEVEDFSFRGRRRLRLSRWAFAL